MTIYYDCAVTAEKRQRQELKLDSDRSSTTNIASLTVRNIAMMFEHIYGVASFIVMLIVLLCVFKMYLALTATCREHGPFLLESATKKKRLNRGQRELEAYRRSNAEEERPREFARRRLPVQHDERRCLGVSILRLNNSFYD